MQLCVTFCISLPLFLSIILFCQLLFHPDLEATHHIRVRFHGVLNHARVVGRRASVPDAVHPDQGAAAVVACESAV